MADLVIRNLSDQLVDVVRDLILDGTIAADQPIRQDALAAQLGISKIPLREALSRLAHEGLVHNHVNRGYFVRPLNADEAEEVFSLRQKLEPEVVALAAERATDTERRHAIASHEALNKVTAAQSKDVGALHRAFHLSLLRPSGQLIVTPILERLHVLSQRYVRKHLEPLGRSQRATEEHRTILELWLDRDGDAVAKAARIHIQQTIADLRCQLAAQQNI